MTLDFSNNENEESARLTKEKDFCHNSRKYVRAYSEMTGIHGLRYLTEKRSLVEKVVWAIILLVSLGGCIYMIYEIIMKYWNSPVVVNFATRDTPVYEIPFPSVTVCPEAKCSRDEFNYTDVYKKYVIENEEIDDELHYFDYMNLLCGTDDDDGKIANISSKTVDDYFFEVINDLKPKTNFLCDFMEEDCSEELTPIVTDEGICYSFNIIGRRELFRDYVVQQKRFHDVKNQSRFDGDNGYVADAGVFTYPRRALRSGADNSLTLVFIEQRADIDYLCSSFFQGFRVSIHNPNDIPRLSKHYFRVPPDKSLVAAIQPELVTTSDSVKKFIPEKRNCFMRTERPLKYFKIYTQINCRLECLTNYTLNKCGCVSFFMPRDNATAICGAANKKCLEEAEAQLNIEELEAKISGHIKSHESHCNCKPLCTDLRYTAETSHSDFYWKEYFKVHNMEEINIRNLDKDKWSVSVLSIYLKSEQFATLERNELYGVSDFISNFGGLLGLFTGFSIISLAEIIYFLTLRIFYNERLYGLWSGPRE